MLINMNTIQIRPNATGYSLNINPFATFNLLLQYNLLPAYKKLKNNITAVLAWNHFLDKRREDI